MSSVFHRSTSHCVSFCQHLAISRNLHFAPVGLPQRPGLLFHKTNLTALGDTVTQKRTIRVELRQPAIEWLLERGQVPRQDRQSKRLGSRVGNLRRVQDAASGCSTPAAQLGGRFRWHCAHWALDIPRVQGARGSVCSPATRAPRREAGVETDRDARSLSRSAEL